ncbi:hypothetical protein GCM10027187_59190 [Streptosporangium sandarakinum]
MVADKGSGFRAIRRYLRCRGIGHTIPERARPIPPRMADGILALPDHTSP